MGDRGCFKKNVFHGQRRALQLVSFKRQNGCTDRAQLFYGSSSPGKTHCSDKNVYNQNFLKSTKKEKSAKNLRMIKMGDVFRCFHLDIKDRVIFAIKLSILILG